MSTPLERLRALLAPPTWPTTIARAPAPARTGLGYDTSWARSRTARAVRDTLSDTIGRPLTQLIAHPRVYGADQLERTPGPVVIVANHASHLDTAVVLSVLPRRVRERTVVAAAADYFFDRAWKSHLWSLLLGAIPIERTRVNRRSLDLAAELIDEGWNFLIFPEGGRTEDGWGQEFSASAAYLARRCRVPVVPLHLKGMRPLLPKGGAGLRPGTVEVRVGAPVRAETSPEGTEESARHLAERIEVAVALLADEAESDWWTARRRAADGTAPSYRGPEAAPWRRAWALPESARTHRPRARDEARPW